MHEGVEWFETRLLRTAFITDMFHKTRVFTENYAQKNRLREPPLITVYYEVTPSPQKNLHKVHNFYYFWVIYWPHLNQCCKFATLPFASSCFATYLF